MEEDKRVVTREDGTRWTAVEFRAYYVVGVQEGEDVGEAVQRFINAIWCSHSASNAVLNCAFDNGEPERPDTQEVLEADSSFYASLFGEGEFAVQEAE